MTNRLDRWSRRGMLTPLIVLCCLALLLVAAAYRFGAGGSASTAIALIEAQTERDEARREVANLRMALDNEERLKRFLAYRKRLRCAREALENGNEALARSALESCAQADRHFEWYHLWQLASQRERIEIAVRSYEPTCCAFHPHDPGILAVSGQHPSSKQGRLEMVYLNDLQKRVSISEVTAAPRILSFSPDGRYLATLGTELTIHHAAPSRWFGTLQCDREPRGSAVTGFTWTPNKESFIVSRGDASLVELRLSDWGLLRKIGQSRSAPSMQPAHLIYRPDRLALACFTVGDREIRQWDLHGGWLLPSLTGRREVVDFVYGSGKQILVARSDDSVRIHDSSNGEEIGLIEDVPRRIRRLTISRDGKRLVVSGAEKEARLFGLAGKSWIHLLDLPAEASLFVAFNSSGRALAALGDRRIVVLGDVRD